MIWKLCGTAGVGIAAYALLRRYNPEYAVLAETAAAAVLFFLVSWQLEQVTAFFTESLGEAQLGPAVPGVLLKVLGVALISQFAADAARDNAQQALAQKIEFAAKVLTLALALPVLKAVLQMISEFAENL